LSQELSSLSRALISSDWEGTEAAIQSIESSGLWPQAIRAIGNLATASDIIREGFHTLWTVKGHRIREQVADDDLLLDALPRILPPYRGPSLILFRGESLARHREKRYGFAWTSRIACAEMFGRGLNAMHPGGGVLLRAEVPAIAIIAGPSAHSRYLDEHEFTVDPRLLPSIKLIGQYPRIY